VRNLKASNEVEWKHKTYTLGRESHNFKKVERKKLYHLLRVVGFVDSVNYTFQFIVNSQYNSPIRPKIGQCEIKWKPRNNLEPKNVKKQVLCKGMEGNQVRKTQNLGGWFWWDWAKYDKLVPKNKSKNKKREKKMRVKTDNLPAHDFLRLIVDRCVNVF
jgi:hypothetical protein